MQFNVPVYLVDIRFDESPSATSTCLLIVFIQTRQTRSSGNFWLRVYGCGRLDAINVSKRFSFNKDRRRRKILRNVKLTAAYLIRSNTVVALLPGWREIERGGGRGTPPLADRLVRRPRVLSRLRHLAICDAVISYPAVHLLTTPHESRMFLEPWRRTIDRGPSRRAASVDTRSIRGYRSVLRSSFKRDQSCRRCATCGSAIGRRALNTVRLSSRAVWYTSADGAHFVSGYIWTCTCPLAS